MSTTPVQRLAPFGIAIAALAGPAAAQFAAPPQSTILEIYRGQLLGDPTPEVGDEVAAVASGTIVGVYSFKQGDGRSFESARRH